MKQEIHPNYVDCVITCGCGEVINTRATVPQIKVEICSKCHPFYTGKQKFVDTAGRVEKFQQRYNWAARSAKLSGVAVAEEQPEGQAEAPAGTAQPTESQ